MRRLRFKAPPGRSHYGRNEFGGVVWRRDDRAHDQTPTAVTTEDNYYLYDGTNQIKERKRGNLLAGTPPNYTGIDPIQQQENWTYDAAGNWTQYSNPSTAAGHTQVREHNDGNELWKISVSGLGEVWPIYDSMGNMRTLPKAPGVSTDHYTLKWDAWNRLVEVKDGSTVVASYTYDGLNRRLTKTAGSETRHYYYDTQWRPLEERVGSSSTPDRQYTWGVRDRWDLIRRKRSTTNPLDETLYVLRDYLDPVAIADAAGNVVERYAYDAFGNVRFLDQNYGSRPNSSYAWDFLFHAEFRDPETKLYNYGHRYYDAGLGRWLSRDPIGERGGVNLYAFLYNEGMNRIDVVGLADIEDHHWFPRCGGKGQGLVDAFCGPDFLEIDDYTTSMSGPSTTRGTAHFYLTHTERYTANWRAMYDDIVSRVPPLWRCCVLLSATRLLFFAYKIKLEAINSKGGGDRRDNNMIQTNPG